MPKIKLKRDMGIAGEHCELGSIQNVSKEDATYLVNGGHATADLKEEVPGEKEAKAKKAAEERKAKKVNA